MSDRTTPAHPSLDALAALAREAGQRILEIYATDFTVWEKNDRSPLTQADMAAHDTILKGLSELTPDIPVLSEESTDIPFKECRAWQRYWLVDPLDGTREFIKRNGEFTVNIALIEDHQPVIGVVYTPVTGITYLARHGKGACKQAKGHAPAPIHVQKLAARPIRVAGSRSHRGHSLNRFLSRIGEHEFISMGSSLKSCLVAEGKADIYVRLGPTSEWDTAAAQCVVEEAGGHITDTTMRPLRYNTKESWLNPHFLVFGDDSHNWSQYL